MVAELMGRSSARQSPAFAASTTTLQTRRLTASLRSRAAVHSASAGKLRRMKTSNWGTVNFVQAVGGAVDQSLLDHPGTGGGDALGTGGGRAWRRSRPSGRGRSRGAPSRRGRRARLWWRGRSGRGRSSRRGRAEPGRAPVVIRLDNTVCVGPPENRFVDTRLIRCFYAADTAFPKPRAAVRSGPGASPSAGVRRRQTARSKIVNQRPRDVSVRTTA